MADEERSSLNIVALVVMFAAIGAVIWWFSSLDSPSAPNSGAGAEAEASDSGEEPEAERGQIAGTVYEARQDQPIAGATVIAVGDSGEVTTESDAEGNFKLEVTDHYVVVHAESPGLRNAGLNDRGQKMVVEPGSVMRGVQLVLYEPVVVEGMVYGDGRPLEASVTAHYAMDRSGATDYDYETTDTDVDGIFRLGGLPAGQFHLRVESSGFAPYETRSIDAWAGDIIDVETINMVRGAVVRGTVVDGSGVGLADVRVSASTNGDTARTGEAGEFELYGVPPGVAVVTAEREGFQSQSVELTLKSGEEQTADFTLTPRSGIVVRVLDANGNHVSGATVTVFEQTSGEVVGVFPVAGEDLYLSDLEGGPFDVEAKHDQYDLVASDVVSAGSSVELVLAADGTIDGLVVTAQGGSARNAETRLLQLQDDGSEQQVVSWTPVNQGRFRFEGLVPGRYVVEGTAPAHRNTRSDEILVEPSRETSATLRLGEGGVIYGVVTDQETGEPVAGAQVGFETIPRSVQTDETGYYQLSGFPSGRNTLVVRAGGYRVELVSAVQAGDGERKEVNVAIAPLQEGEDLGLELVGVGMQIRNDGDRFLIGQPVENAGAARAGLQQGDAILSIDGEPTGEMSLKDVVEKIRGEEGTAVRIAVERNGEQFEVEIERQKVIMGP